MCASRQFGPAILEKGVFAAGMKTFKMLGKNIQIGKKYNNIFNIKYKYYT